MENTMIKKLKLKATAFTVGGALALASLGGCGHKKAPMEAYDVLEQNVDAEGNVAGLPQVLEVPEEDFVLVTEYTCDDQADRKWRVTSDKFLYCKVHTKGLSEDTQVYIDNIHVDVSIKSEYEAMDGIFQDGLDDHPHSSQMLGFPISDDMNYFGSFAIEGMNKDFIQGSFYGYESYSKGKWVQRRYTEEDYLEVGVYANKFQIVYDLLIKGPNDKDFRNTSVSTDFLVYIDQTEEKEEESAKVKVK